MTPPEYTFYIFIACFAIFMVPGPVFFLSVHEGIRGFRRGVKMLLGVLTAESMLLAFIDMGFVIILERFLDVLRIAGAFLLILLGASTLRGVTKGVDYIGVREIVGTPYARGFSLTFLNVPFILWLMTVGSIMLETGVGTLGNMAYIIFDINLLGGSAVVTLAIILSAHFGKRVIGARGIRALSLVSGASFIVMATVIIVPILDRLR